MIWPAGTPNAITIPSIPNDPQLIGTPEEPASDPHRDECVIDMDISKVGYMLVFLTWRGLYLYRPKPLCPVIVYIRSKASIEKYGENVNVLLRPDSQLLVVTTSKDCILTYSVVFNFSSRELGVFTYSDNSPLFIYEGQTISTAFPGPGEAIGIRELLIQFKMVIRLDSGISCAIALDHDLLVLTKNPPAIQLVKWNSSQEPNSRTMTILLSQLDWLPLPPTSSDSTSKYLPVHNYWSKAMGLFSWTISDGSVWAVTMAESKRRGSVESASSDSRNGLFTGHCFHYSTKREDFAVMSAINARFSLIAVGCRSGYVHLYNVKDYSGNVPQVKVLEPPSSSSGTVTSISCSGDGYGWVVGYENGWAFYSVFGMPNAMSFLSSKDQVQNEPWLGGVTSTIWSFSGDAIYMIPKVNNTIWMLDVLKWNSAGNFTQDNITRPVLYKDSKIMIYRGQEQSDLTTIDKDALLWLTVPIPASYIAENWPIKYVSCSADGMYIAVAGLRGLTHYSLYSGHWKQFIEEEVEREFSVRGGMVWYGNILIIAVDTETSHELQLYSRETDLDSHSLLYAEELNAAVLTLFLIGDSIMVYTTANQLLQFKIYIQDNNVSLEMVEDISFMGIIHSPARVRSISCLPRHDVRRVPFSITESNVLLLVDGMLILLIPRGSDDGEMKYKYKVLHHNIEYYALSFGRGNLKNMIWAFDGQSAILWVNGVADNNDDDIGPVHVPLELYPLTMMSDKGIIMGIDCDAVLTRNSSFTYFKQWTSAQLFGPYVLEAYLSSEDKGKALSIASGFRHLNYFGHILEILLYRVLDKAGSSKKTDETDPVTQQSNKLLANVVALISHFPQMLDVVVGCTRKTEVKYWKKLFDIIGSPQLLFEKCIERNKLTTAGGYLLVLHTLEQHEQNFENTSRLLKLAYDAHNWDLCKELSRFITATDPTGETLRKTLKEAGINVETRSSVPSTA